MPKRKSSALAAEAQDGVTGAVPAVNGDVPALKRRASQRTAATSAQASTNPNKNADILDGSQALRASPSAEGKDESVRLDKTGAKPKVKQEHEASIEAAEPAKTSKKKSTKGGKQPETNGTTAQEIKIEAKDEVVPTKPAAKKASSDAAYEDPEADGDEEAGEEEIQEALSRPPPVHSDYLPLPWKGRLGYACLCTYLRNSNPPVFSSRTCRIASILEHRHPLKDPSQPEHATKNRPDKEKPASIRRGQEYVEALGKANARDIVKMLRWNHKYGIKFLRLSSEMFPFASHEEYGYTLAPFVSEELAEAGRVAAELGHRLTTHPGQYTQLGSPRKQVIDNALRDLDYHAELLDLLKLPPQQDRDAVMILHIGGVFGDKVATLDRFRENYAKLPANVKKRLVLENDDVSWHVHDVLPLCEELNIPMVLDYHHHNILFDSSQIREGTKGIIDLYPRILATWKRKNITPKMHYSEQTPASITPRQRRKHNPRVATLPPCPPDMDLMIEAKDKEQAVFELMRTFKLPGWDSFNDIVPYVRNDDNKPIRTPKKKTPKKKSKKVKEEDGESDTEGTEAAEEPSVQLVPEEEVGMGGPENRVYWPPGMEEWLRPKKRVIKPKKEAVKAEDGEEKKLTPAQKKKAAAEAAAKEGAKVESEVQQTNGVKSDAESTAATPTPASRKKSAAAAPKSKGNSAAKAKGGKKREETPVLTDEDDEDVEMEDLDDQDEVEEPVTKRAKTNARPKAPSRRQSGRAKQIKYTEASDEEE